MMIALCESSFLRRPHKGYAVGMMDTGCPEIQRDKVDEKGKRSESLIYYE